MGIFSKKTLRLFNSATNKIENFHPRKIFAKVYSCGPTLYQQAHIGNLRAYVFADTLNRTLSGFGYRVKHIINLTDVGHLTGDSDSGEDKVEKEAMKQGKSAKDVVEYYKKIFFNDLDLLNIDRKKYKFPYASKYIKEQINMIKDLEKKSLTYKTSDGVYFDTSKFKNYGELGNIKNSTSQVNARIEHNYEKRNSKDFALWKFSPKNEKRQQEWSSPWGVGFPGWHIECSAMANSLLGKTIDIHTGGIDHLTIHHNNEIAQSESYTNKKFSHFWMHSAFLSFNKEKIAKSIGNVILLEDLINRGYPPLSLRYLFLLNNYRTPLNFSFGALNSARRALDKLNVEYNILATKRFVFVDKEYKKQIQEAIADNLNTSKIIAIIFEILKNKNLNEGTKKRTIHYADKFLGILTYKDTKKKKQGIPEDINQIAKERKIYRDNNMYDKSDELRDLINKMGYKIKDLPNNEYKIEKK